MTPERIRRHRPRRALSALVLACSLAGAGFALAAPGAHGPDGEHLDTPALTGAAIGGSEPRFEAQSEIFELVGRLEAGALSLYINRYETSEPVLDAKVEVESGEQKAIAKLRDESGDYAVHDAALLGLLSSEGEHPLLITILAGEESDLLDGLLTVAAAAPGHDQQHETWRRTTRAALLAAGLLGAVAVGAVAGALTERRRSHGARREPLEESAG